MKKNTVKEKMIEKRNLFFVFLFCICSVSCHNDEGSRIFEDGKSFGNAYPHSIQSFLKQVKTTRAFRKLTNAGSKPNTTDGIDLLPILRKELNDIFERFENGDILNNITAVTQCEVDILEILLGLIRKEMWAFDFIDAFGKPGSGITLGNLKWPGSYSLCTGIEQKENQINFSGKYCWLSATVNSSSIPDMDPVPPLLTAICIPSTCSEKGLLNFYQLIFKAFAKYLTISKVSCVNPKIGDLGSDPKAVTSLVIISLFLCLILIGTIADCSHRRWANKNPIITRENKDIIPGYSNEAISVNSINIENSSFNANGSQVKLITEEKDEMEAVAEKSWLRKILESFSIYANFLKIFDMKQEKGTLPCLHGIRFLSMCWVILGHTVLSVASFLDNPADALPVLQKFYFQLVVHATFSVDSFFLLSGLLVTYLYLKECNKTGNFTVWKWLKFYIHRYLRLTPTYILVLFIFVDSLFKYYSSGPFWMPMDDNCSKSWWRNLLYINNFQNISDMCMGYSWYLATDMQFYLISPIFLYFLTRCVRVSLALGSLFILGSWITTGIISSQNNVQIIYDFKKMAVTGLADPTLGFNTIYDKPYCRIGAYLVGMACGWLLHKTNCKSELHKVVLFFGWIVSAVCLTVPVFGLYEAHPNIHVSAFYASVTRTVWAIGLAWIVFACCSGYGGVINKILSWSLWVPFSRLTYCAYLIHLIVIEAVYLSMESLRHFTITNMIYDFFGHLLFSYIVATAVCLMFEAPLVSLEKKILQHKR